MELETVVIQPELTPMEKRVMRRHNRRSKAGPDKGDPNPYFNRILQRLLRHKTFLKELHLLRGFQDGSTEKHHLKKYLKILNPVIDHPAVRLPDYRDESVIKRKIQDKEGVIILNGEFDRFSNYYGFDLKSAPVWYWVNRENRRDTLSKRERDKFAIKAKSSHAETLPDGRIVFIEPKQAERKPLPLFYPIEPRNQGFEGSEGLAALAKNQVERLDFLKAELIRWKSHKPRRGHSKIKRLRKIEEIEKEIAAILRKQTASNRASCGGSRMREGIPEGEQSKSLRRGYNRLMSKDRAPPKPQK